jgi:hypothetical protein
MFAIKSAAASDLETAKRIMQAVYAENPSYWPYGLDAGQFDGGLYLISKQAGASPVGFVGWQEREREGRRIGYYAVGVLPEYRRSGFAKAAVSKIVADKSASVDEVRAMIMEHNTASKSLAQSLAIPIEEKLRDLTKMASTAGGKPWLRAVGALLGAAGTTAGFDRVMHMDRPADESLKPWTWDERRALMGALNAVLGASGGYRLGGGHMDGFIPIGLAPTKDLALQGLGTLHKLEGLVDPAKGALTATGGGSEGGATKIPKELLLGALGLGVGGLGVAAYAAKRKADAVDAARGGRVKVTLPTKDPDDAETTLDIPIEDINMSNALRSRLGRDARRRLHEETRKRTQRRKPKDPANPTQKEIEDMELLREEAELAKESRLLRFLGRMRPDWYVKESAAAPQSNVPTPPPQGVNPAQRMTQQQVAANSIDTSTAANPQIMKAQQQAAQAEAATQQQVAQLQAESAAQAQQQQQQAAQAQMQMQQQHAEQLSKLQTQNEMLKLQVEKAKVQSDLEKAKQQASEEIAKARSSASGKSDADASDVVRRMTQTRLQRLHGKIKKAASDATVERSIAGQPGTLDPATGKKIPEPSKVLRPGAARRLNRDPSAVARGLVPQVGLWRTSYGPVGDWLYSTFLRGPMNSPSAVPMYAPLSAPTMLNNPDTMGMIDMVNRQAQTFMRNPAF